MPSQYSDASKSFINPRETYNLTSTLLLDVKLICKVKEKSS